MFGRTAPAAHLPLSPPTPNQCSSVHTHFFQFQFSALVLQGPRMGAGRRPEQIFPSVHPRLRRSPIPFFFFFLPPHFSCFFFLFLSAFFLSVCPFLPANCPIWPSLPFVFFPISPMARVDTWGARRRKNW